MLTPGRIFLILNILSIQLLAQNTLQMKAFLQKSVYLMDEPVDVGVSLVNQSNSLQTNLWYGTVWIIITDSTGKMLPYTGVTGDHFSPNKNELQPGEENYDVISIEDYYGKERPRFANKYFTPGSYTLKVLLLRQKKLIDSTLIPFQVVEPAGDELIVHKEYVDAVTNSKFPEEYVNKLRCLADAYPNSVYLPNILNNLGTTLKFWIKDREKAKAANEELIEKCSGYRKTYGYILQKIKNIKEKSKSIEFLNHHIEKNKNNIMQKKFIELLQKESEK